MSNFIPGMMLKGGSPDVHGAAFLDTNVFGVLMRRNAEPNQSYIYPFLYKGFLKKREMVNIVTSPYALFEYLGVSVPRPPQISYKFRESSKLTPEFVIEELRAHLEKFYKDDTVFSIAAMRRRADERRPFVPAQARDFFDGLVAAFLEEEELGKIQEHLIWDAMTGANLPQACEETVLKVLLTMMNPNHTECANISCARVASRFWMREMNDFESKHGSSPDLRLAKAANTLKYAGDFLDSELIHFALFGWHFLRQKLMRTHCFTADSPEVIESRIMHYIFAYRRFYMKSYEIEGKEFVTRLPEPGFIHCVHPVTLELVKSLNIRKLLDQIPE